MLQLILRFPYRWRWQVKITSLLGNPQAPCLGRAYLAVTLGDGLRALNQEVGMDTCGGTFAMRNFGSIDLGDRRRTAALVKAVDKMCRHPGGTLPDKLNRPADLRAFYRLMRRPEVTHQALLRSHADCTRSRIAALQTGVVLVLHDATELDYTTRGLL